MEWEDVLYENREKGGNISWEELSVPMHLHGHSIWILFGMLMNFY